MGGYHVGTRGEVAELGDSSVKEVDVLKKADCWNFNSDHIIGGKTGDFRLKLI